MREPLAVVGVGAVVGAAVAPWLRADALPCLVAVVALCLLALVGRRWSATWLAVPAAACCLGLGATALRTPSPTLTGNTAVVGRVLRATGGYLLLDTPRGRLSLWSDEPVQVGDQVAAWVQPARPPPLLPGAHRPLADDQRLATQPVRARQLLRLGSTRPTADPFASARHRGLLRALALGDRSGVDDATRDLLRRTGTSHLLAISGLHIGLLAGAVGGLAWLLSRPLALTRAWPLARLLPACAAACAAVLYALAVGSPASARRAATMVGVAAGAVLLGRRPRPWSLLGLAATAMVLSEPGVVGELGFQLSFSAVAGILLMGPRVTRWLPPDQPAPLRWLVRSLSATVGATAGTLPVVAWRFQLLAPLSPLANLVAAPLVGSLVVPAALAGAWLPASLAHHAVTLADLGLDLVLALLHALDRPPWSPAVGPVGLCLLTAALLLRRHALSAAVLATLALGLQAWPRDRLVVTFLAVGQGDGALVEWPDGRRWLVDGGPAGTGVLRYLRRRGIRHLDALVLSHDHPDHSGGLVPVAEQLDFDELWLPRRPTGTDRDAWRLWQRAWQVGAGVHLPDDAAPDGITVEHPVQGWRATGRDAVNEESLVLHIQHGDHSVLFSGDIEEDAEATLALMLPPVTVVKVPHHGSRSSSTPPFVAATRPALAVVSAGRQSRFGHPHLQAMGRWRARTPAGRWCRADRSNADDRCATRLLRVDQLGSIEWSTDGHRWALRSWRADRGWAPLPGPDPP